MNFIYSTKEVSEKLEVGASTIRKWCLLFEAKSYHFSRNPKDQRQFYEKDIKLLERFKTLTHDDGVMLENAIDLVLKEFDVLNLNQQDVDTEPTNDLVLQRDMLRYNDIIRILQDEKEEEKAFREEQKKQWEEQQKFNRKLVEMLAEQQRYISERLDKRDQQLLASMREVQETKKLIATAKEEKSFFQRFFGKD